MEPDFVLGGGLAGLVAANALADHGRRVVLLEQSESLGGRARTIEDRGYFLNFGPHALYRAGKTMRTLEAWGISLKATAPVLRDGAYLTRGEDRFPFVRDAAGLAQTPLFGLADKARAGLALAALSSAPSDPETAEDWICRHASTEPVRDFFRAIFRVSTYAADLTRLGAGDALEQLRVSREGGVLYLDHGWQSMIDLLAQRARSLGVEIRCGQPVTSLPGDRVILAVSPDEVHRLTNAKLPDLFPARMACLTLGLASLPEKSSIFALGMDRPLYLSVHSRWAKVAPEGRALIHLGKYLSGEPSDPTKDRAELEHYASLHLPGWRDRAEAVQFLPSMVVTPALPSLSGRPAADAVPGVFLAGDWVGPEGMIADAATASGLAAAQRLLSAHPLEAAAH